MLSFYTLTLFRDLKCPNLKTFIGIWKMFSNQTIKNNSAEKARMNMKAKKTKWSISLSLFTLTLFRDLARNRTWIKSLGNFYSIR